MNRTSGENRGILDIQAIIRAFLARYIAKGDVVVDGTAGLGRDSLFLAQCVGDEGQVFAFDIQAEAINATRQLLETHGVNNVTLLQESHSEIARFVPSGIKAGVFNLGYLPGHSREIVTNPASTLRAVTETLKLLSENGIIAITVYRGHQGGMEESKALTNYLAGLPKKEFSILQGIYLNQGDFSPYWIIVQKTGRKSDENPPSEKNSGIN